jgi:hypothetical protein
MTTGKLYYTVYFRSKAEQEVFDRVWERITTQLIQKEILMRYPVYKN